METVYLVVRIIGPDNKLVVIGRFYDKKSAEDLAKQSRNYLIIEGQEGEN